MWGAAVSESFCRRVIDIADSIGCEPDWLMACMAFETGETFSPSIRNAAGSGATGLIQFMPATARGLGTSTKRLASMTAVEQLEYVARYFEPYSGRLHSLSDTYMAILWPAAIGKTLDYVLWDGGIAYMQNRGLDLDDDGSITKREAAHHVLRKLTKGQKHSRTVGI